MSYAITHLVNSCSKNPIPSETIKKRDRITIAIDSLIQALLVTTLVVLILIAKDIIPVQMSSSLNTVVTAAFYGSCALSGLVSLADTFAFCVKQRRQNLLETPKEPTFEHDKPLQVTDPTFLALREAILSAPELEEDATYSLEMGRSDGCHPIVNNLVLGGAYAFIETSCVSGVYDERGIPINTQDPQQFTQVISLSPLKICTRHFKNKRGEEITNPNPTRFNIAMSGISWLNMCDRLEDEIDDWNQLVDLCTFDKNLVTRRAPRLREEVWFIRLFEHLDAAVLHESKTLLHCSTGKSVSVAALAAYLINRCLCTHTEVLRFIRSKNPYIDCAFETELEAYAKALGVKYPSS